MKQEKINKVKDMIDKYQKKREEALYRACFLSCLHLDELITDLKDLIKEYEN